MKLPDTLLDNHEAAPYWDTQAVHDAVQDEGKTLRSTERALEKASWLPPALGIADLVDEFERPLIGKAAESFEAGLAAHRAAHARDDQVPGLLERRFLRNRQLAIASALR